MCVMCVCVRARARACVCVHVIPAMMLEETWNEIRPYVFPEIDTMTVNSQGCQLSALLPIDQ